MFPIQHSHIILNPFEFSSLKQMDKIKFGTNLQISTWDIVYPLLLYDARIFVIN